MAVITKRNHQITFARDISNVVTALQELSVLEMQRIRNKVLATRQYMDELVDIFIDIRLNYERYVTQKLKQEPRKKRTVLVLLSQNVRFSDSNLPTVFASFLEGLKLNPQADIIILGTAAEQLAAHHDLEKTHHVTILPVPDRVGTMEDFAELFSLLGAFEEILLFHGTYKNLLTQESATKELNGSETLLQTQEKVEHLRRNFLYEPEIEHIVEYFEKEVRKNLFLQSNGESRLAHLGSRIQNLEQSRITIEEKINTLSLIAKREARRLATKKQLQRLAGRSLW